MSDLSLNRNCNLFRKNKRIFAKNYHVGKCLDDQIVNGIFYWF